MKQPTQQPTQLTEADRLRAAWLVDDVFDAARADDARDALCRLADDIRARLGDDAVQEFVSQVYSDARAGFVEHYDVGTATAATIALDQMAADFGLRGGNNA